MHHSALHGPGHGVIGHDLELYCSSNGPLEKGPFWMLYYSITCICLHDMSSVLFEDCKASPGCSIPIPPSNNG